MVDEKKQLETKLREREWELSGIKVTWIMILIPFKGMAQHNLVSDVFYLVFMCLGKNKNQLYMKVKGCMFVSVCVCAI